MDDDVDPIPVGPFLRFAKGVAWYELFRDVGVRFEDRFIYATRIYVDTRLHTRNRFLGEICLWVDVCGYARFAKIKVLTDR